MVFDRNVGIFGGAQSKTRAKDVFSKRSATVAETMQPFIDA